GPAGLPPQGSGPRPARRGAGRERRRGPLGRREQPRGARALPVARIRVVSAPHRPGASAMSEVKVRLARPEDDERLGEILVSGYVTAYARKMPQVVLSDRRKAELREVGKKREQATVLVAELEGRVVGTVTLWKKGAPQSEAWLPDAADLRHLAIDPALQGKGLSSALLDEAERIAREEWRLSAVC